ncbi:acylneuraminate cytidylyltransferase family protein [Ornithinimicrobium cryptoxanthini]|uniref:Acylneuraminate cytidylyltransferase family protein n=1 Tax=Ornithinimicrobium cryptoxanthini TaxID=2934161 RepID=A0ABY4YIK1_9MICO|nr:acylneuraminate cytidylyltransferase family protein [Ornithinimicrobium cryptoxanthini]USQ76597.1 acylneuraminate cytidylyltransferase family protein [Ornithinimicrobium cryptoxanthini]
MTTLCLIPARGGSKGIPGKNLREVAGKPLIVWTIEQALEAESNLDVVVSTDSEEIAEIARQQGADVPFLRPCEFATDTATSESVVEHAIAFRTEQGRRPDQVMLLQATSPVRMRGTLDRAMVEFTDKGVDTLVGVVPRTPFYWEDGPEPRAQYDVMARPRRQDLTRSTYRYFENGSLYVTRTEIYETQHNRIGGRVALFILDEAEGIDIDTLHDLAVAEERLRELKESFS